MPASLIAFNGTGEGFGGNGGINNYGGGYQLGGNPILEQQEREYVRILGTADSFEITGGKLHIYSNGDEIIYRRA